MFIWSLTRLRLDIVDYVLVNSNLCSWQDCQLLIFSPTPLILPSSFVLQCMIDSFDSEFCSSNTSDPSVLGGYRRLPSNDSTMVVLTFLLKKFIFSEKYHSIFHPRSFSNFPEMFSSLKMKKIRKKLESFYVLTYFGKSSDNYCCLSFNKKIHRSIIYKKF